MPVLFSSGLHTLTITTGQVSAIPRGPRCPRTAFGTSASHLLPAHLAGCRRIRRGRGARRRVPAQCAGWQLNALVSSPRSGAPITTHNLKGCRSNRMRDNELLPKTSSPGPKTPILVLFVPIRGQDTSYTGSENPLPRPETSIPVSFVPIRGKIPLTRAWDADVVGPVITTGSREPSSPGAKPLLSSYSFLFVGKTPLIAAWDSGLVRPGVRTETTASSLRGLIRSYSWAKLLNFRPPTTEN